MQASKVIAQYQNGLLSEQEAETRLQAMHGEVAMPVKWETEISKICLHPEIEYDFDYGDGYPMLLGGTCIECGQDFPLEFFSESEIMDICDYEAEEMQVRQYEAARDYEDDLRAGLL